MERRAGDGRDGGRGESGSGGKVMEVDGRFVIPNRGETAAGRLRWEWVWKGSENGASVHG